MSAKNYAGDVTPQEAWDALSSNENAVLVDVRTNAEWNFVGIPNLSSLNKECQLISWVMFPGMTPNPEFLNQVKQAQTNADAPIYFLCRSGVRSIAAAVAATEAGFKECYNILEGFEGDPDQNRHRGNMGGWKKRNLDWVQN